MITAEVKAEERTQYKGRRPGALRHQAGAVRAAEGRKSLRLTNNNFLFPFEWFYAIIDSSSGRGEIPRPAVESATGRNGL